MKQKQKKQSQKSYLNEYYFYEKFKSIMSIFNYFFVSPSYSL